MNRRRFLTNTALGAVSGCAALGTHSALTGESLPKDAAVKPANDVKSYPETGCFAWQGVARPLTIEEFYAALKDPRVDVIEILKGINLQISATLPPRLTGKPLLIRAEGA